MTDSPPNTAVIWDLDGTLVHLSVPSPAIAAWKREMCSRLSAYGWQGVLSPMLPTLERALAFAEANGADGSLREDLYIDLDRWELEALEDIAVNAPLAEAMLGFVGRGIPSAIVTNNGSLAVDRAIQRLHAFAEDTGMSPPTFEDIVCRSDTVAAKPSSDGMIHVTAAIEGRHGPVDHLIVFGDMPSDREAAEALQAEKPTTSVWVVQPMDQTWDWQTDVRKAALPRDVLRRLGL